MKWIKDKEGAEERREEYEKKGEGGVERRKGLGSREGRERKDEEKVKNEKKDEWENASFRDIQAI